MTVYAGTAVDKLGIGTLLDKTAIGLSALCAIHCLALPLALALLPSIALLPVADESFHKLLIWLVLPTSVIALTLGCRRHQQLQVLAWGLSGLSVLVFAAFWGHDLLGENLERWVTVFGASIVAMGHVLNYRHCQIAECQHD